MTPSVTRRLEGTAESRAYVGMDRRARIDPRPSAGSFVVAGAVLVVASVPFALIAGRGPLPDDFDARTLNVALLAMTVLLAFVVGCVVVMQWRYTGETRPLRIGIATPLVALAFAVNTSALIVSDLDRNNFPLVVAPAARVVAIAGFLIAFFAAEIDTRLTPRRIVAMAASFFTRTTSSATLNGFTT